MGLCIPYSEILYDLVTVVLFRFIKSPDYPGRRTEGKDESSPVQRRKEKVLVKDVVPGPVTLETLLTIRRKHSFPPLKGPYETQGLRK